MMLPGKVFTIILEVIKRLIDKSPGLSFFLNFHTIINEISISTVPIIGLNILANSKLLHPLIKNADSD